METKRLHDIIPELQDYYTITQNGEIYSDNCGLMKIRNKKGTEYQLINLSTINGCKKTFRVHRLVLMSFNPVERMENLQVNHIDCNKKNNCLNNLEWCTNVENMIHACENGLIKGRKGENNNFIKLNKEDINKIFFFKNFGLTNKELGNLFGCTPSNIGRILNKKTWNN